MKKVFFRKKKFILGFFWPSSHKKDKNLAPPTKGLSFWGGGKYWVFFARLKTPPIKIFRNKKKHKKNQKNEKKKFLSCFKKPPLFSHTLPNYILKWGGGFFFFCPFFLLGKKRKKENKKKKLPKYHFPLTGDKNIFKKKLAGFFSRKNIKAFLKTFEIFEKKIGF